VGHDNPNVQGQADEQQARKRCRGACACQVEVMPTEQRVLVAHVSLILKREIQRQDENLLP
jgi:hypothetical protein